MLHLKKMFYPFFFADGAVAGSDGGETSGVTSPAAEENTVVTSDADGHTEEKAEKTYTESQLQDIIQKRLKKYQTTDKELSDAKTALESHQQLLDKLSIKYGVDSNVEKIMAAMDANNEYIEEYADKNGMSVEAARKFLQMQLDDMSNKRKAEAENKAKEMADAENRRKELYSKLDGEAAQVKAMYPEFDWVKEWENNPKFKELVGLKVDMRSAYEVTHINDIKQNAAKIASEGTEKAITENIRAKGNRPKENGATAASGFTANVDFRNMSAKEFADYRKKVESGKIKIGN